MRRIRFSRLAGPLFGVAVLAGCQMLPFLGGGPTLAVDPGTLDLGATATNGSLSDTVAVENTGGAAATVTVSTTHAWLQATPSSFGLDAGESQTVTVTATCEPALQGTSATGTVTFAYGDESESVDVTVTCLSASEVSASPAAAFLSGEEGQTPAASVTLVNTTGSDVSFTIANVPGWLQIDPAAGTIPANAELVLDLSLVSACPIGRSVQGATLEIDADETLLVETFQVCAEAPANDYNVDIRFFGEGFDVPTIEDFLDAAQKWETVITSELDNRTVSKGEGACSAPGFPDEPALTNEPVDDLLLHAGVADIDGAFDVVGSAGPCVLRSSPSADAPLPAYGTAFFDTADVQRLRSEGRFGAVVLHEMGHAIGVGTLWDNLDLVDYAPTDADCRLTGSFTTDPTYAGPAAIAAYDAMTAGSDTAVPLENEGGGGTQCGHWDEDIFDDELMTGWLDGASDPLSSVTGESLTDLGYATDSDAYEPYGLPPCSPGCDNLVDPQALQVEEILLFPRYEVTPDGTLERIDAAGR